MTSNTCFDWLLERAFLVVPAQDVVGAFLRTFEDDSQRQKAASFNRDEVMWNLQKTPAK